MAGTRIPGPLNSKSQKPDKGLLTRTQANPPGLVVGAVVKSPQNPCTKFEADIPMSPVWHMIRASQGSRENFDTLQNAVDFLTCKAKKKLQFNGSEKEFLKEVFEALWWGGKYKGYPEAAQLANHYVNGKGHRLKIKSEVYESSIIVKDTMVALKTYIAQALADKRSITSIKTGDASLKGKPYYSALTKSRGSRNYKKQGYILKTGALLTEQNNQRLKNADNRFYLQATVNNVTVESANIKWSVESDYDFQPFEKADYYTNIPLSAGMILKLPDGLSEYMVHLGVAAEFTYYAEWSEVLRIEK